jgi:hypothetical protein
MIIVEGPDGAGKTTLVNHLSTKFDLPVNERVVDQDTKPLIPDMKHWVELNLRHGLVWKIFDRHRLISEPIYQCSMGRTVQDGFNDINWMTARMLELTAIRPFIVYCLPPIDVVQNTLEQDVSNTAVVDFTHLIYPAYVAKAAGDIARGQAVKFDWTTDSEFTRVDMLFELWLKNNRLRLPVSSKKVSAK